MRSASDTKDSRAYEAWGHIDKQCFWVHDFVF